jgi:hypothetical protein
MGLVSQVFDETSLQSLARARRDRATAATRRPAARPGRTPSPPRRHGPRRRSRSRTTATSSTRPSCATCSPRMPGAGPAYRREWGAATPPTPRWSPPCSPTPTARSRRSPCSCSRSAGRVLLRLHGRAHPVCRPRPPRHPAAGPRSARPRLGRGLGDGGAADIVGAAVIREIEPGELIVIDEHGLRTHRFAEPEPKGCVFEYVYLARPDAVITGGSCTRRAWRWAARLAREHPVEADLVIGVPDSGCRQRSATRRSRGSPSGRASSRTPMSGAPSSSPRRRCASSASGSSSTRCAHTIRGKRLVVVDDSIVRGNTQRAQVRMLREAGAPRCTCGSPRRRCTGRASTASTSRPAPSSSPRAWGSRRSGLDRRRLARLHLPRGDDRGHEPPADPVRGVFHGTCGPRVLRRQVTRAVAHRPELRTRCGTSIVPPVEGTSSGAAYE